MLHLDNSHLSPLIAPGLQAVQERLRAEQEAAEAARLAQEQRAKALKSEQLYKLELQVCGRGAVVAAGGQAPQQPRLSHRPLFVHAASGTWQTVETPSLALCRPRSRPSRCARRRSRRRNRR